jgi:hypothetical protein
MVATVETTGMHQTCTLINQHSSPEDKIALFRSLFRGRDDVYPRRFASLRTGKSGYQPACTNEWLMGVCDKPKTKCIDCPNYRRDRRKDLLLQEHGYLVLRFLAEDVGKRLDDVLDMILRVLAHQGRSR